MYILVLHSSWWGRESRLFCLICLPGVSWWLSGSSSWCHGLSAVCDWGISWSYSLTIFATILMGKWERAGSFTLNVFLTVSVLWLFLTVPWVGLHCVIVLFPDHTHLLFCLTLVGVIFKCLGTIPFYFFLFFYFEVLCVTSYEVLSNASIFIQLLSCATLKNCSVWQLMANI